MTKLEKIVLEIVALPQEDVLKLATWFAEFHADLWHKQIEAKAGRLNDLITQARADHKAGRTTWV